MLSDIEICKKLADIQGLKYRVIFDDNGKPKVQVNVKANLWKDYNPMVGDDYGWLVLGFASVNCKGMSPRETCISIIEANKDSHEQII